MRGKIETERRILISYKEYNMNENEHQIRNDISDIWEMFIVDGDVHNRKKVTNN